MKRSGAKKLRFKTITLAIILWLFFAAAVIWLIDAQVTRAGHIKTEAVIVRVDKFGSGTIVTYRYNVNDETFEWIKDKPFWMSAREGGRVTVYYDPDDPFDFEVGGENILVLIAAAFSGAGAVFFTRMEIKGRRII